jgi:beta-glucanase (GH16 family)
MLSPNVVWSSSAGANEAPVRVNLVDLNGNYPVGTPSATDPSGEAPPSRGALVGYTMSYEHDFSGTTLPPGWDVFEGTPGGDPGGYLSSSHVQVADGVLEIDTYQDPALDNEWVTGGLCQCGVARTYGAYFVRSRDVGTGPSSVELLWPKSNQWPPEIDFNENGGSPVLTTMSVHYGATNHIVVGKVNIDMESWHTWGVIWTPGYILYTVDGRIWSSFKVPSEIPNMPMTLDFEQIQHCDKGRDCPFAPASMQINWVVEYQPNPTRG